MLSNKQLHEPMMQVRVLMQRGLSSALARSARALMIVMAAVMVMATALTAGAQTGQGSIGGTVRDPHGAVVAGASVDVVSLETGVHEQTTTSQSGFFQVAALNPGQYRVKVVKAGFQETLAESLSVSAARMTPFDVTMAVGKAEAVVTVNADDDLLTKDQSDVITTVDHSLVESLPYPERSSLEAALLVPGVQGDNLQPGGISTENPGAYTSYVTPGASIIIGGTPPGTSSIVVDGSDVTQASLARTGVNLSGSLVKETTVITTGLSAKYGRTGGGVIVQSSAPGTNQFHGSITYRHTDPFFNAYPLGSSAANALHENYYGFYVGGPVWIPKIYPKRDRTFFFVGVEPARMRNTYAFRGIFPTADELAGHLHNSLALLNQSILKTQGYQAALAYARVGTINYQSITNADGFPNGPYDPKQIKPITGPLADCGAAYAAANPGATSCPDDVAPQLAKNPFAQYVLSQFPTPSNPGPYVKFDSADGASQNDGTNAVYRRGVLNTDNRYSIRIDQQFSNNDQLFVRYTVIPVIANRFFAVDPSNPLTIVPVDMAHTHDVALGYTHVFSNTVINGFHYSFMRVNQQRLPPPITQTKDFAAAYGLTPATFGFGFPSLGNLNQNGVGYTMQMGLSNAAIQVDQNFIAGDDVSWSHGLHLFQFGADIRWIQSNQYDLSGSTGGKYNFLGHETNNGQAGGAPLATFILGTISAFSNTPVEVPEYYRWHYYAGYFQDDWRIRPNLTLNLGVRYEVETPRMEKYNNQAFIRLNTPGNLNGFNTTAAFCFSNACGNPRTLWPTNYWGWEPRIGIAYAPTNRTTVRAAYTLQRLPLSGYENIPDPNFNVPSQTVNYTTGGTNPNALTNYITNPIGQLTSAYVAMGGNRGPFNAPNGFSPVFVSQTSAVPYTQSWSATVQYQLGSQTVLQATYNGSKATHLVGPFSNPLNIPTIPTLVAAVKAHENLGLQAPNQWGITQNGSVVQESNLQLKNPYQNFFNQALPEIYPRGGTMEYNAMYLSVTQRLGRSLSVLANYTWSKTMDNVPDTNTGANGGGFGSAPPQDPTNPFAEWSVASFDQASRLKAGYTWNVPLGQGHFLSMHNRFLDQVIGNISTAGIATVSDGLPSAVTLGTGGYFISVTPQGVNSCNAGSGNNYCVASALPQTGYTLRPNIVPGVPLINKGWKRNVFASNGTWTPYLNPAAFVTPGSQDNPSLGNAPRLLANARSPRETLFDMRVNKGISFEKRYQLNVNATFSNVFNHPVYYGVNKVAFSSIAADKKSGVIGAPVQTSNFGQFNAGQTAGMSRVIRVGAEFVF